MGGGKRAAAAGGVWWTIECTAGAAQAGTRSSSECVGLAISMPVAHTVGVGAAEQQLLAASDDELLRAGGAGLPS